MDSTEIQFRTATFGGFQKQDVLDYIERSTKEHGDQLSALRRELEESNQAQASLAAGRDALEAALAAAREQAEALAAEQAACSAAAVGELKKLEALKKQIEEGQRRAAELESSLSTAREELAGARAELEKLRPAAEAYEHLKDRTAGIELEAHCRAQGVQAEAEDRVRCMRVQMEQWLCQMRAEYGRLRQGMDATVAQAGEKLKATGRVVEEVSAMLSSQDKVLEGLIQACMADLKPQAPAPLPLEEQ